MTRTGNTSHLPCRVSTSAMTDVLGQPCGYTVIPHSWLSWFIKLSTFLWTYIAMEKSFVLIMYRTSQYTMVIDFPYKFTGWLNEVLNLLTYYILTYGKYAIYPYRMLVIYVAQLAEDPGTHVWPFPLMAKQTCLRNRCKMSWWHQNTVDECSECSESSSPHSD